MENKYCVFFWIFIIIIKMGMKIVFIFFIKVVENFEIRYEIMKPFLFISCSDFCGAFESFHSQTKINLQQRSFDFALKMKLPSEG